jgi:hypothetical protein
VTQVRRSGRFGGEPRGVAARNVSPPNSTSRSEQTIDASEGLRSSSATAAWYPELTLVEAVGSDANDHAVR